MPNANSVPTQRTRAGRGIFAISARARNIRKCQTLGARRKHAVDDDDVSERVRIRIHDIALLFCVGGVAWVLARVERLRGLNEWNVRKAAVKRKPRSMYTVFHVALSRHAHSIPHGISLCTRSVCVCV